MNHPANNYDAIIIGAGMSGLAAGIRLSMYGKKVCIVEKHVISGGLNSYYARGKRPFDVGLHALTNFCQKGERKKPLGRLLQQLRIPYEQLKLQPQQQSRILFPDHQLTFTNDFHSFYQQVITLFPQQKEGLDAFLKYMENYNELDLRQSYQAAKEVVGQWIRDENLLEMIFCPLLIYGSAWEDDMDFSQFVIMFKSIFLQGFSRPQGGVRTILNLLLEKYQENGGELLFNHQVSGFIFNEDKKTVQGVTLKNGKSLYSNCIISSMGYPETLQLCQSSLDEKNENENEKVRVGRLSFVECLMVTDKKAFHYDFKDTIIFYNNEKKYHYRKPAQLFNPQSAVICCSENFQALSSDGVPEMSEGEGLLRVTMMANYDLWCQLSKDEYRLEKEKVYQASVEIIKKCIPQFEPSAVSIVFKDVFTPKTIQRYTGHLGGTVYGSPDKSRDGKTPYAGLYLCGTDQGFLGIVGAMLSGITIANLYGLMDTQAGEKGHHAV